jgi:hypothetical protein
LLILFNKSYEGCITAMPLWEHMGQWIYNNLHGLLPVIGGAVLICIALSAVSLAMGLSLKKRYRKLMMGREDFDLEGLINRHGELIEEALQQQRRTAARLEEIEERLQLAVAGVGMVRYNAFQDTGSDLSFSLALLDRNLNGVVVTSLFGREESRCYGKIVKRGKSIHFLSEEEIQALEEARRRVETRKRRRKR